ncbi:hypothetical protein A5715_15270 [Mycolicibacter heraklionensis]|nr:hypothetical protein A5715_15270 [Mycolicibacter heraklionensis]
MVYDLDRTVAVAGVRNRGIGNHVELMSVGGDLLVAAQFVIGGTGKRIPVVVDGARAPRSLEQTLAARRVTSSVDDGSWV